MTRLRLGLLLMLAALAMPPALAAEPTLDDKVRHLLQGLDDDSSQAQQFEQSKQQMIAGFKNIPPEAVARIADLWKAEYEKVFGDRFTLLIDVYKAVYTPEEIDWMYQGSLTPTGAAILAKNATIRKEITAAVSERSQLFYRDFMAAIQADPELRALKEHPPRDN